MTHTTEQIEAVAAKLIPMEVERLTGWQGPTGAAYNAISEGLCEAGLLNSDWTHTALGLALRDHLKGQSDEAS